MVLPSSRVVLEASGLVANMVSNLMADMVAHLMANMMASVMTLSIGWISSEHMAGFDWGRMGTIGITLAIGSSVAMSKAKSLTIAVVDSLASVLVVDRRRVDGGGRL